jgi:hypothetical protein
VQHESKILASYDRFGSVMRCQHGCVHIQLGQVSISLSEEQYLRLAAMINESAANFEFFREPVTESEIDDREETS